MAHFGHSPQHALLNMLRKWQASLSNSGKVGAVLMDLSKAFDCLPHDLLIAKMAAYGFGQDSLEVFLSYLKNRKHRVRIGSSLSDWLEILLGVPQGSVLGPILFNIFLNDLFLFVLEGNISNYADDNTLYACDSNIENVIKRLNDDIVNVLQWFRHNGMVANPDKFQLLFPGTDRNISLCIGGYTIDCSDEVKLLGITIDRKLSFYPHIKKLCRKAAAKTKALIRIRRYLNADQANILCNTYIMSSFNYCPLVWMFCSKQAHNLINATHRRALSVKLNEYSLGIDDLLSRTKTVSIHTRNLRLMLAEVYKSINQLNPEVMWNIFVPKPTAYKLRCGEMLSIPKVSTTSGLSNFEFRAALAWNNLPAEAKESDSIDNFNTKASMLSVYCNCKHCS